jgi:hypothetical protein
MFGYNEVISHMERSLEVWQIPPITPCVWVCGCVCMCVCVCRVAQSLQKCRGHLKILGAMRVTSKFRFDDPQILRATVQNLVPRRPGTRNLCTPVCVCVAAAAAVAVAVADQSV